MPSTHSTRWCPTPEQLMILEEMYRSGVRTPNASQIQQIAAHLSLYGKIEGKNVFYWFQNHKARDRQKLRRRQLIGGRYQQLLPDDQTDQAAGDGASSPSSLHLQRSSNFSVNEEAITDQALNLVEKLEAAGDQAGQLQEDQYSTAARSTINVMEHHSCDHQCWPAPEMMAFLHVDGYDIRDIDRHYCCGGGGGRGALKTLDLFPIKSTGFKDDQYCSSSKSSSSYCTTSNS